MAGVYFRLFIFGCVSRDTLITYMAVISIPDEFTNNTTLANMLLEVILFFIHFYNYRIAYSAQEYFDGLKTENQ